MPEQPVAIVTGANRGLGLETSRQLAALGYRILLTARRAAEGRAAAEALATSGASVAFQPLDVTDDVSVRDFAERVRGIGRLDVLVNNAGVFLDPAPSTPESSVLRVDLASIRASFETNTLGPLRLCQALISLMTGHGRVVNVSSGMGQLAQMNGFCPGYRLSKTALNALTRILADELQDTGIKVNAVCPGWVRTDMGGAEADLSVEEGARGIVWAATLPADGPSGGFFRHGQPIDW